jgi:hypothetical protein
MRNFAIGVRPTSLDRLESLWETPDGVIGG